MHEKKIGTNHQLRESSEIISVYLKISKVWVRDMELH